MGNALTPVAVWVGRREETIRNADRVVDFDRRLTRVTGGRVPLLRLVGLPELTLHVPGRRSGIERSTPLLCASFEYGLAVVGSNWGKTEPPSWVANLRAAPEGSVAVTVRGNRIAVDRTELDGERREEAWAAARRVWPNYDVYARRTERRLPVFLLTPRL